MAWRHTWRRRGVAWRRRNGVRRNEGDMACACRASAGASAWTDSVCGYLRVPAALAGAPNATPRLHLCRGALMARRAAAHRMRWCLTPRSAKTRGGDSDKRHLARTLLARAGKRGARRRAPALFRAAAALRAARRCVWRGAGAGVVWRRAAAGINGEKLAAWRQRGVRGRRHGGQRASTKAAKWRKSAERKYSTMKYHRQWRRKSG